MCTKIPKSDAPYLTSPFAISVAAAPAAQWMPLSSHPCLTLTSGILPGPGPSLLARLVARLSTVLRPDPPPGRLRRHFPLTVIGDISSTSFPRRAPRASPVGTSSFVPCRRCYPAGEGCRIGLVSSGPCCLRTLSTVSATGLACNEATPAFTARCNLVLCQYSISSTWSEGSAVLLSRHGASQATRPESFSLGRTSTDWRMCPSLDTATG